MKDDILEAEVRLLLLKYGSDAILRMLAVVKNVSAKELMASIARLEGRKPVKQDRRPAAAVAFVANMKIENPEKAALLKSLALRFDERTFLPELREVRAFLHRFRVESFTIRSRQDSARKLFECLASLTPADLSRLRDESGAEGESVYSELAAEIIGTKAKGHSSTNGSTSQ